MLARGSTVWRRGPWIGALVHLASCVLATAADAFAVPGPQADEVEQLLGVDGLRQIVGRAGLEALVAVVLQRLGGDRDDRDAAEASGCARIARIVS